MTRFRFNHRLQSASDSPPWKRRAGVAWLAIWLLIAGGFGYRHLSPERVSEAQASSRLGRDPAYTKSIEQIQVGERVAFAINPTEQLDESLSFDVNPRTWRKITLKTSQHEVVLLRPVTWVNEHLAHEGSSMMLVVPELGIDEPAEVVSIWPCPEVRPGEGRIVLGTFTHIAPETICMYLDGQDDPIRCTPNHITWSVEHRDFVEAHELTAGSTVLCDDGVRKIARVEKIAEPIRVYNLEVQGQHVYQVSSLGMLVHNASPRTIDIRNLSPHPSAQRTVADAAKLEHYGAFNWAEYTPIVVENMSGRMVIMDGMTRVEMALRAGITHLPAFVY